METKLLHYNLFKEIFNNYKKKYKPYIFGKKYVTNRDNFKKDTLFFINGIKNLTNYSINVDNDEDNSDEYIFQDDFLYVKIISYLNKVDNLIDNYENNDLNMVLIKIINYLEDIFCKSNEEVLNLEVSIYKLKILLYLKNITKYLDIVKNNFDLYKVNYNSIKNERNFMVVNQIRLLAENLKCIHLKYKDFCDYFSNNFNRFDDVQSLINKMKQTFILLLKEHTIILKKYS